jgi:arylamine N-acetyltransferase
MVADPLANPPPDSPVLRSFLEAFRILRDGAPHATLERVATAFTRLPYENLTKILKRAESGCVAEARRPPIEVIRDHLKLGTGGTCFSLTATLLHLVRALGWEAHPLLADRRYGSDTHCALVVWISGKPHLLDPGYLLVQPVPLPTGGEICIRTAFNEVVLTAKDGGNRVDLHTIQQRQQTYRLTFKAEPVDRNAFLRAWDASFDWDMMNYPVLSRLANDRQLYLQQNRWLVRGQTRVERKELDPQSLAEHIAREFGITPSVAARALAVLQRKGEGHGCSPAA